MKKSLIVLFGLLAARPAVGQESPDQSEQVHIGGQPSIEMLDSLAAAGYEAVLSVRGADELDWNEAAVVDSLGMSFTSIPMAKPVDEITDEQLAQFNAFMQSAEKAYMHCGSGNRVAGLWAVWLVEYQHVDIDEALSRAEAAGMTESIRNVATRRLELEPQLKESNPTGGR